MSKFEESNFYKALQDFFINADKKTFLQFLAEFYNRTEGIIDKDNIQDDLIKELRELYLEFNEKGIDENIVREKVNYFLENNIKIKDINSQLKTNTHQIEKKGVDVELFGAVGDGIIDDSLAIQNAINYARENNINIVNFDSKTYICNNVSGYSGLQLQGVNNKTVLKRSKSNSCIKFIGQPISNQHEANVHVSNFGIYNIKFDTADINTEIPCVDLTCVGIFNMENCTFHGQGKQLLLWEAFDSRIYNCNFNWGGRSNGLPAVELRSTNGGVESNPTYEYTNNIYFDGCRFETYVGSALETTGKNTNLIFVNNCKFESRQVKSPHLKLSNANALKFKNVLIATNGSETYPPLDLIKIKNSQFDVSFMNIANNAAINKSLVSITDNSITNDFILKINNLSATYFNKNNYVVYTDMTDGLFTTNTFKITCPVIDDGVKYFPLKAESKIHDVLKIESVNKGATIQLKRNDMAGYWELGRIDSNGFKLLHNNGTTEESIISINSSNEIFFQKILHLNNSIHLWNSDTQPWTSGYGTMYVDTTNEKAIGTSMGGVWRYQTSANAVPTTGTWKKNTIVWNNNPSIGQPIGWICTESGSPGVWRKFGTIETI